MQNILKFINAHPLKEENKNSKALQGRSTYPKWIGNGLWGAHMVWGAQQDVYMVIKWSQGE